MADQFWIPGADWCYRVLGKVFPDHEDPCNTTANLQAETKAHGWSVHWERQGAKVLAKG